MTGDPTVVCVNDDREQRTATVSALDAANINAVPRTSIRDVTETLSIRDVDAVVTAATVDDGDASDLVSAVRASNPDVPVILFDDVSRDEIDATPIVEFLPRSIEDARTRLVSLVTNATLDTYQVAYPVPGDEQARIEALRAYDFEDLRATDAFDRLTTLVARYFDVDVAFVGLVDEHEERFVACEGANWERLAREDTICTHTILQEETMVIEDVTEDPRFVANDRLLELDIRSYAGVRLTTPAGHAIGALCCTDDETRSFTETEVTDLELFAEEVMEQLLLRRRLNDTMMETTE